MSDSGKTRGGGVLRLVLVGAGHTHVEVLRRFGEQGLPGIDLTVVTAGVRHHYSGMVPGYLQGTYDEAEIAIDVASLCRSAGARLVVGRAAGVEPAARRVLLEGGVEVPYDLVSFAVGSSSAGTGLPGVAEHAARVKPIERAVALRRRLVALAGTGGEAAVVVVGGGAAGVEVALAADAVLARAGGSRRVVLFEADRSILPGFSARFRSRALALLGRRGIEVAAGCRVERVEADCVVLEDGARRRADLTVWVTGAVGLPIFRGTGLPVDRRGFLLVDRALRSRADPTVFAAGDCATLVDFPDTPKAGVFAVREGPVLWQSLAAAVVGGSPPAYSPQSGFLAILNTADGKGLLRWKGAVVHSRAAWWLKDWIDRRFMRRYRASASG